MSTVHAAVEVIHGPAYLQAVKREMKQSRRTVIAVAFWGEGAESSLALRSPRRTQIICNLTMGGTNPDTIRNLKSNGFEIRHLPTLHAKVIRFESCAIVGSANASANGLNFEGKELAGWDEVGVVVRDQATLEKIDEWLEMIVRRSKLVDCESAEFKSAERLWHLRRSSRGPVAPKTTGLTLLQALRKFPSQFADREIYAVRVDESLSEAGEQELKKVQRQYGTKFYVYEGWPEIPRDADIIEFFDERSQGGRFKFNGFYRSDSRWADNNDCQVVLEMGRLSDVPAMRSVTRRTVGHPREWQLVFDRHRMRKASQQLDFDVIRLDRILSVKPAGSFAPRRRRSS